ncbi:hypothetical protein [Actinomycetospora lemnae]|uniref:Uncharacterized protein n=1 Tax=Actinomycetospora lemnae TaxID=3019891 RepID=A0ABT5STI9_9PSEU|nr:hypothetical protein [Actinomycetospora sp. DW7H6]MDD7966164.1 hypothetical protein [Actinomycetospora sp. DW7H6]
MTLLTVALATITTVTSTLAADHVWALAIAVVAAAVVRAVCAGGVTSILCLAAAMVVGQPAMHALGELTHAHDLVTDHHSTFAGLVLVAVHVALFVVFTALIAAGDMAGRAVVARFRRLVRIVLRTARPPLSAAVRPGVEPPIRRPRQRLRPRLPERRGPPSVLVALAA